MSDGFEAKLEALLKQHLPGCERLLMSERLSGGASQETYRIVIGTASGERILAMRRASDGSSGEALGRGPGLETEAALFGLARSAGIPEPQVFYVLQPGDGLGQGFIMEWIEGEALGAKIARAPEFETVRETLAFECGAILAKIHAIDIENSGLAKKLERVPPRQCVEQTWERYQTLGTPQPMLDYTARWLLENLPRVDELTLVHNDFRNGNFMVDPRHGVVAVLDWELACIGDPMRDLGWICTNSWRFGVVGKPVGGFGSREDLFSGYESIAGKAVDPDQVRFWEVFGSFWWSVTCLQMMAMYRSGIDATVERPAIGRRASEGQMDCVNLLIPGVVTLLQSAKAESLEMPRTDELLSSVRDYLRNEVMARAAGRMNFLSRVAANSLDIVLREMAQGPALCAYQLERLQALLGEKGTRDELMLKLSLAIRGGDLSLETEGLAEFLRRSVAAQVAIDQPKYSGLKQAIES